MKKILFLVVCSFWILTGCKDRKLTTYDVINYDKYVEMIQQKETFSLIIGSSTCSACSLYKGTIERFINEYQVDIKYIDLSMISEEEFNLLQSEINFSSTPTTIFIKEGKHTSIYDRIIGAESYGGIVSKYKKMGYIGG